MPHIMNREMQQCIDNCTACHNSCVETAAHCMELGGEHAAAEHIRALVDCAELCAASANFMLRGSQLHPDVCGVCADACERCAEECERMGDDEMMKKCAAACRRCAESCRKMANMTMSA